MDRREFVTRCVLQNKMTPADAVTLWADMQAELMRTISWDKAAPGPFLQGLHEAMACMSPGSRRTLFALIGEEYNLRTGEPRR